MSPRKRFNRFSHTWEASYSHDFPSPQLYGDAEFSTSGMPSRRDRASNRVSGSQTSIRSLSVYVGGSQEQDP
jgi:hypothetical protein